MYVRILSRLLLAVAIGLAADDALAAQASAGKAATAPVTTVTLLGQRNRELLKRAFKAADRKKWRRAYQLVDGLANPLPAVSYNQRPVAWGPHSLALAGIFLPKHHG